MQELKRARSIWRRLDSGGARWRSGGGAGRKGRAGYLTAGDELARGWRWLAARRCGAFGTADFRPRVRDCSLQFTSYLQPIVWTHLSV